MIIVKQQENFVEIKFHTFSGGEEHVNVILPSPAIVSSSVEILARIDSSSELMRLLLVTDALKRLGIKTIELVLPYIPYARQDRVCNLGDSFSLKIFANLINSQGYSRVHVTDAHSTVATALLDNVVERAQSTFAFPLASRLRILGLANYSYIVAPDAGASKKAVDFARGYNLSSKIDVLQALKVRDPATGNITKTELLSDNLDGADCLIVDDICDGGRTFTELAKVLKDRGAGSIGLFVTHGIFSRGLDPLFEGGIDAIYTTDSFHQPDSRVQIIHNFFPTEQEMQFLKHL
jgi:ribose-phosphate pyrophosphokinase